MKSNKTWFVTGASKGLGLSLARAILQAGGNVAATTRSLAALQQALGSSERLLALEVDLVDERSVQGAVEATLRRFGRLDVVVNNAGYGQLGAVEELSDAEARQNFDVNVFGLLNVLRATLPHLREQRSGHVYNIGSIGGFFGGFSGWGIYCATKFAVAGISESLHADLAEHGVHVSCVYPGYFRTEFLTRDSVGLPARPIAAYAGARASHAQHLQQINHQQPGDPERLAQVLIELTEAGAPPLHLFLGSDAHAMAEKKVQDVRDILAKFERTSRSTDFSAG
jgi:NAD(P)-dependent dehydrogenase (short-subunit alcohol dehydrogenase family)